MRRFATAAVAAGILANMVTGGVLGKEDQITSASRVTGGRGSAVDFNAESGVSELVLERERRLLPTIDLLSELPGFQVGGLDPDPTVDRVFVYWNGAFGREAQDAVDGAKRNGITVDVIAVPYSNNELHKIAASLMEALAAKGMQPQGYCAGDPFDEIAVWGDALDSSEDARRAAVATAAAVLPRDLKFAIVTPPDHPPSPQLAEHSSVELACDRRASSAVAATE